MGGCHWSRPRLALRPVACWLLAYFPTLLRCSLLKEMLNNYHFQFSNITYEVLIKRPQPFVAYFLVDTFILSDI